MENTTFLKQVEIKWADVDPNMHLRYTVYIDFTDLVRISYFTKQGISFPDLQKLGALPIIFNVHADYKKEVLLGEVISIDCRIVSTSENRKHFTFQHNIYKENGKIAATITIKGAWFNIRERKVAEAPRVILDAVAKMDKALPELAEV